MNRSRHDDHPDTGSPLPDGLAAPARRALAALGITRLQHLATFAEDELRLMHGMGPRALERLRAALHESGLTFADGRVSSPPARPPVGSAPAASPT